MATTTYSALKKAEELHRDDVWAVDQPGVKNPVTEKMGVSRGVTLDKVIKFIAEQEEIGGYINETVLEEQERAEGAEGNLNQALAAETARAQTVEQQLASDIVDEQTRAEQAEGALQLHLDTEEARAIAAEQNLSQQITQAQQQNTSDLAEAISAEQERAQQAESELQAAITDESVRAQAAETNLGAGIQAEANRADAAIAGAIQAEANRADTAIEASVAGFHEDVAGVQTALDEETARAEQVEGTIQTALDTEVSRAQGVEGGLQTALTNEITRAQEAEQDNAAAITTEKTRAKAEEQLITTALTAETNRAKAAEQTNTISIDAEEVRAKEAEERLDEAIDAEENRAKAVEQTLSLAMVRKSSFESGEVIEDIWVFDSILDRMVLKKRLTKADGSGYRDVSVEIPPAAADRAGVMSIGDKQNLENLKGLLLGASGNIQEQINSLNQMGHYYGAFDTYNQADVTHTSLATDTGTPTPNDFAHIRADETQDGAKTRYVWKDLGDGTYAWVFDVLIDQEDRNFTTSPIQASELADTAVVDTKIGERTINSSATDTPLETGTLTELLSNLSGRIEDKHERLNGVESVGNIELDAGKQVRIKDSEGTPHTIAQVHSETVQAPSDIPLSDTTIVDVEALNHGETGIADILLVLAGKENVSAVSLHGMITAAATTHIQLVESDTDSVLFEQDGSGVFDVDLSSLLTSPTILITAKVTNTGTETDTIQFSGMYVSVTADTLAATAEIGDTAQHTDLQSADRPTVNGTELIAYQSDIAAEAQRAQTAEQANAQAVADEEQRAQGAEAEKLTKHIEYGNGIVEDYFLDANGGGHKMEDGNDNSLSFSGFNHDADNPVKHETSVKNKSNGIGARLLQTLAKLFYTKNQADDSITGDDEIQVKADVDAAVQAAKTYTDQVLAAAAQATTYAGTLAKESGLPSSGSIHGQYYEVDDMDTTAPGKSGRAIWNGVTEPAQWDKRVDQQREADGVTIGFRGSDGALEIHDVEMTDVTADITDYGDTVSGGFHAVLLGVFKKIRGLFSLVAGKVNVQQNTSDAGKAVIVGSDGKLITGKPALLADGAAADDVIGNRTLTDEAADAALVPVTAKKLLPWLQGIRNNLKYLFNYRLPYKGANNTAGILIDLGADIQGGAEILFDILYNETQSGNLIRQSRIHGQLYGSIDRTGMVQNGNVPVPVYAFKGTDEGIGSTHVYLWIPSSNTAYYPSAKAEAWDKAATGFFATLPLAVSTLAQAPAETLVSIKDASFANTWVNVPFTVSADVTLAGFFIKHNAALNVVHIHFDGDVINTFTIDIPVIYIDPPIQIASARRFIILRKPPAMPGRLDKAMPYRA
jgi:hypothetical protein